MLLSLFVAASMAPLSPADEADLRCIAIYANAMGAAEKDVDPGLSAGLTGAMMYYLGKIEGRSPNFELEPQLTRLVKAPEFLAVLAQEQSRCGNEMVLRGDDLQKVGQALQSEGN